MLVIKMQEDDMLVIGDDVRIYVRQVAGSGVKLCIDAPREVVITRLAAPREAAPGERVDPSAVPQGEPTERVARARRPRDTSRRV
jgi:hypothetical protein